MFCRCRRASGPFFNLDFLLFRFFFVLVNFLSGTSHALDATLWTFLLELHTLLGGVLGGFGGANNVLSCAFYLTPLSWCYVVNFLSGTSHALDATLWTILPCSPQKMMSCLVDLLKKYHDFQWRLHPLKQIVWLHCKMTKKTYFSPSNYEMKPL